MKNIVIVDGVRTPFGRLGGGLRQFHPGQLQAFAIKALMERTQLDPKDLDSVCLGIANGDGRCPNFATQSAEGSADAVNNDNILHVVLSFLLVEKLLILGFQSFFGILWEKWSDTDGIS